MSEDLQDPPIYDTLTVKFRGDNHEIVLPYCEVANGDIKTIGTNCIYISVTEKGFADEVKMTFEEFLNTIEKAFDTKEITKLSVQAADSYDTVKIL
jgi:hypothetical protein